MGHKLSRRGFLKTAAAASTVYSLMPGSVLGANEKVNLAFIGIGGQGHGVSKVLAGTGLANIVALCDVDMGSDRTSSIMNLYPDAKRFKDFRKMFDKMGDRIDAVSAAVPDHSHFPISMMAMSLGKHVFVEKPLAHTFQEIELMMAAEKKYKVVCQMGNQGHSGSNYFQFKAWHQAGIIKNVRHVHAYMNKWRRWHPWGDLDSYVEEPVPETLDWDKWLAARPFRPFNSKLAPGNWRSWYHFGNGAFGDWGPHILDTIHRFLKLGLPKTIEAVKLEGRKKQIYPMSSTIRFDFPERGEGLPAMDITWYDGQKNFPPRPKEFEAERRLGECGKFVYSDDFVFHGFTHGSPLRIVPETKMKEMKKSLPRITGKHSHHYKNFLLACKGQEKARSPFHVAGPLSQVFSLGVIAQRLGGKLEFDRTTKKFTNSSIANQLLTGPPPRKDWQEFYKL